MEQSRKWVVASSTARCSSSWKVSLRVALDHGRRLYFTYVLLYMRIKICTYKFYKYIYIYIYICIFFICTHMYIYVCILFIYQYVNIIYEYIFYIDKYMYTSHISVYINVYICVIYIYIYICMCIYVYILYMYCWDYTRGEQDKFYICSVMKNKAYYRTRHSKRKGTKHQFGWKKGFIFRER